MNAKNKQNSVIPAGAGIQTALPPSNVFSFQPSPFSRLFSKISFQKTLSVFFFLLLAPSAHAESESLAAQTATPSVFFSPEEVHRIESEIGKEPRGEEEKQRTLTLDSILYFGPQKWTVWLGGEKWTPETKHARLKILSVTEGRVKLSYKTGSDEAEKEATLFPHQTLNIKTGEVTEGK